MVLLFASMLRATWSNPTFLSIMTKKPIAQTEINSNGTHQLAFRRRSSKVFLGAKNVLTKRAGSERPGPAGSPPGSGERGIEAGYTGDGGGVGPVGELINHPTLKLGKSYPIFPKRLA